MQPQLNQGTYWIRRKDTGLGEQKFCEMRTSKLHKSLGSEDHQKLNRSWNTVVKMIWDLPFASHKRFVESMTEVPHLQSMLHGRYIGFLENLRNSKKVHLQVLFNMCKLDQCSNTGQNISYLLKTCELNDLNDLIKNRHSIKNGRINPLEEGEDWKVQMIEELSWQV